MKPTHHPHEELLMEYAAGALGESHSLMVATHLSFCPECRAAVRKMEAFGGAMLNELDQVAMSGHARADLLARLDGESPLPARSTPPSPAPSGLPTMRDYLPGGFESANWKRLGPGMRYADIHHGRDGADVQLIHVKAGSSTVQHSHKGNEWTLVLTGAYDDGIGCYHAGDAVFADGDTDHNPTALPGEDCICMVVIDAPIRLTGPIGRLFNPLLTRAF